jgi:DNA helicase-2/ATP-dependent DNA helicase PcrA
VSSHSTHFNLSPVLSHLNDRQRAAVLHGEGPLLVLAGAGSGKTSTMASRIAHLIAARGVPPAAVLGLSFTNKAARELKERVKKLAGRRTNGLIVSTFHSLCVRILRAHGERLGFQPNFSILDTSDQKDVLKGIFKNVNIDDRKFDLDRVLFEIGQAKNRFLSPDQAQEHFLTDKRLAGDYGIAAATAYGHYQEQLKALNSMDFDDLLFRTVELLENFEDVRKHYNDRFRYLLVDEYQDTNPAQFKLLRLLTQKTQNLCVVGDDDQSIYGWRGADSTHILEFKHQFSEAAVILLDQNYRSKMTILNAANGVIKNNSKRHPKSLWSDRGEGEMLHEVIVEDDRAEAQLVADEIWLRLKRENRRWKDFAVLYRSNSQSRVFEEAFRRAKIPYAMIGGSSFLERKEVKDTLSLWRVILNPKDEASLRRVLLWAGDGIGRTSLTKLSDAAFASKSSLYEAFARAPEIAPRSAAAIAEFVSKIETCQKKLSETPADQAAIVEWARETLRLFELRRVIEEDSTDAVICNARIENVEELLHSLGQIQASELQNEDAGAADSSPQSSDPAADPALTAQQWLREYLVRMALDAQEKEEKAEEAAEASKDDPKNQVTLLTLHGAKGLEYPVVFMVGMEEGFMPHKRSVEEGQDLSEERRLCYVGITRARDQLVLTRAKSRMRYGKPVPRIRSRFMEEIPANLLSIEDAAQQTAPDLSTEAAREAHEVRVKSFLGDILSQLKKS